MKKFTAVLCLLALCLSLAACGNNTDSGNADAVKEESTQESDKSKVSDVVSGPENAEVFEVVPETENAEAADNYEPERYETDTLTWDFDADTGTLSVY